MSKIKEVPCKACGKLKPENQWCNCPVAQEAQLRDTFDTLLCSRGMFANIDRDIHTEILDALMQLVIAHTQRQTIQNLESMRDQWALWLDTDGDKHYEPTKIADIVADFDREIADMSNRLVITIEKSDVH